MEHVPRAVLQEWSAIFTSLCDATFSSGALDSTDQLSCFAKCTLHSLARSGARHKNQVSEKMRSRLGLWAAGRLSDLWNAAPRLTLAEAAEADSRVQSIADDGQAEDYMDALTDGTVDARILQRCRKALREGALSKAASALRSTSVATVTRDVLVKMNLLHPDGASIPMLNTPPQFGSDDDVTHSMLRKCILSFPPLSAAGPSGLKPFYLNDILCHTTAEQQTQFLESIKRFVLKALRGELSLNARIISALPG